ncbi:MAG: hypothetical protein KF784_05915 [Fimbriimonadaceae bacterium]|nr:hypothetical protein [Fimbriimonadaceae bacterium]
MKKQKPPVILASVIVVLLGIIFAITWQGKTTQEQLAMEEQMAEMKLTGAPREATSKEQMQMATKKSSESVETSMDPASVDRTRPRKPHRPSIFVDEVVGSKPKPNDTNVSSQWYQPESKKK